MGANEGCVGASRRCMRANGGNIVTSDGCWLPGYAEPL